MVDDNGVLRRFPHLLASVVDNNGVLRWLPHLLASMIDNNGVPIGFLTS